LFQQLIDVTLKLGPAERKQCATNEASAAES